MKACVLTIIAAAIAWLAINQNAVAQIAGTEIATPPQSEQREIEAITVVGEKAIPYRSSIATGATKTDTPLRDIPQAINVVPQAVLRDQGARSMQDVLRNVPGVGASHGDGQRDQVTIRGFSAIADQFIDGIRDDALYFRDLSNIDRVEILKGPAAVLYGRGSSGGLINRVTKKPEAGTFGDITLNIGSHSLRRMSADVNATLSESSALRVTGALEDSGNYRDQQFLKRSSFAPSFSYKLSGQTSVFLQAEYAKDNRVTDFGIPSFNGRPVNVRRETYYGSGNAARDDYSESEVGSASVVVNHRFNDALSVRNVTRFYQYDLDRNNTLPSGTLDSVAQTVGRSRGFVRRQEDGYFNQTDFTLKTGRGAFKQDWLFGVELGKQNKFQQFASQANIDKVNIFNPGNVVPPAIPLATINGNGAIPADSVLTVVGFYAQDQITLSEQWKALIGLRYDDYQQETMFARVLTPLARTDKKVSPRAGVVWQPSAWASYYVSVSQSFQPSAESFALAANNAANEPEITTSREIGAKLDLFDSRLSVTASLFNLERTNVKTTDPANPNVLINTGKQRTNGFELTANGRIVKGWEIVAGYAFLDGRITQSTSFVSSPQTPTTRIALRGNRPSLTPKHSAFAWVTHEIGNGFSAAGGLTYTAERFASPSNAVVLPGYLVADLAAYYRTKAYEISVNLKNITDKAHIVSSHGGNDNLILPGPPRELQVALRYKF